MTRALKETKDILFIMRPLLPDGYIFHFKKFPNTIYIYILKNENIVADSNMRYSSDEVKEAQINNVSSTVGNNLGTFLIYIHVYIALKLNITDLKLINCTLDPVRASEGIYKMFEVDTRGQKRLSYATMSERLKHCDGEMRLRKIDLSEWIKYFKSLTLKFYRTHNFIWNTSAIKHVLVALNQNNVLVSSKKTHSKSHINNTQLKTRTNVQYRSRKNSQSKSRKNSQSKSRKNSRSKAINIRR
jgi:hypothetical protein